MAGLSRTSNPPTASNTASHATEFDLKLRHIEEQYAARREGADAYRDQELARLFGQCGWGQEKIATHLKKKQVWVSQRLLFGRFLKFIAARDKSVAAAQLTKWRFRDHYKSACRAHPGASTANWTLMAPDLRGDRVP